jgi:hypothetical protein
MAEPIETEHDSSPDQESVWGTIIGWGVLFLFSISFGWYVGAPLIQGERWSGKREDAINLVKNWKPTSKDTLYDMIRNYSLKAKEVDVFVGEFKWDALQREGPDYEVTLLWTEGGHKHVGVWRIDLSDPALAPKPQQGEAGDLPAKLERPVEKPAKS